MQTDLFLLCTKVSMLRFANSYILGLETFTSQMWRKSRISWIWKLLLLRGFGENLKFFEIERMLRWRYPQAFGARNQWNSIAMETVWLLRNLGRKTVVCPDFGQIVVDFPHPHQKLMKSVGSCGSLSLLFMMKMMVQQFVIDSHKGYLWLHSCYLKKCCGDFSAISLICSGLTQEVSQVKEPKGCKGSISQNNFTQEPCSIVCMYSVKHSHTSQNRRQSNVGIEFFNSCICIMFPVCSHLFSMMFPGFQGVPQDVPQGVTRIKIRVKQPTPCSRVSFRVTSFRVSWWLGQLSAGRGIGGKAHVFHKT
jgi:hypothetical protein